MRTELRGSPEASDPADPSDPDSRVGGTDVCGAGGWSRLVSASVGTEVGSDECVVEGSAPPGTLGSGSPGSLWPGSVPPGSVPPVLGAVWSQGERAF